MCNLECPSDSKVERIDNYDPIIASTNIVGAIASRRKRAILMRKRESIKIVPGDYIRHRREINDSAIVQKCCECKCDFDKCPEFECPPNEYKVTVSQGSRMPGNCCPTFQCHTERPTCYSIPLNRYFNPFDTWKDGDCTHCECSEFGEIKCEVSSCRPLTCEKKREVKGECCPVCDISDSKFCGVCDVQCPNGFKHDPINNCAICACAKSTPTTKRTAVSVGIGNLDACFFIFNQSTILQLHSIQYILACKLRKHKIIIVFFSFSSVPYSQKKLWIVQTISWRQLKYGARNRAPIRIWMWILSIVQIHRRPNQSTMPTIGTFICPLY